MISFLQGTIIYKTSHKIEVLVNGLGYEIYFSPKDIPKVKLKDEVALFTHHHVAEDRNDLYGFLTREDKQVFEMLLSVSGIGPKTALNIFSIGGGEEIIKAITKADVDFFRQVKGLGNKGSQRIIVDLKNKVGSVTNLNFSAIDSGEIVFQALLDLGFTQDEVRKVLVKIPENLTSEDERLKSALKLLGRANRFTIHE